MFGTATYNAVKVFQRNRGLSQDGIVGKNTWNWLLKGTKM
ncbi:MAG: peptidoglycan-binding domain-containing protein [Thomasclavelia ramosa]